MRQQPATAHGECIHYIKKAHQDRSQIVQKLSKKSTKTLSKSIKNLSKIYQNRLLGPKRPQERPKSPPRPKTLTSYNPPPPPSWEGFGGHGGPKSHPKATSKAYKI